MQTNFSLFRERLAEACRLRGLTHDNLCSGIGIGGSRAIELEIAGFLALDVYRLTQIADKLDVSIDWLFGRSEVMSINET